MNSCKSLHSIFLASLMFSLLGVKMSVKAQEINQPKSGREVKLMINQKINSYNEPFPFIITRDLSLYLEKKSILPSKEWKQEPLFEYKMPDPPLKPPTPPPCNMYRFVEPNNIEWIYLDQFRSISKVLLHGRVLEKWSYPSINPYALPSQTRNLPPVAFYPQSRGKYPPPFKITSYRPFFNSSWNGEAIGFYSAEYHLDNWEKCAVYSICFHRGNIRVNVFSSGPFFTNEEIYDPEKYGLKIEQPFDPDPREVAWRIDQYLKGDPLEKFSVPEKQKLKTLKLTLPQEPEFEQGKEYPLDFPRKLTDGTVPAEIRLVVSRGEIQQVLNKEAVDDPKVIPNPASLTPDVDGNYTVLFGQPDKQTVHCYHIDETGKCLAWGEIEVLVKKSKKSKIE